MDEQLRRLERDRADPELVRLAARRAGLDPWRDLRDALDRIRHRKIAANPMGAVFEVLARAAADDVDRLILDHVLEDPLGPPQGSASTSAARTPATSSGAPEASTAARLTPR